MCAPTRSSGITPGYTTKAIVFSFLRRPNTCLLLVSSLSSHNTALTYLEAEHHPALGVFGDVAVRHPEPAIRDVQQDVHGLARAHEHGVLPYKVGLRLAIPGQDEEAASSVDVEGVVHRVIRLHLVDEPDLHPVAHLERPGDGPVLGPGLAVDELPDHVAGVRGAVDLRHQVLPLEAVALCVVLVPAMRRALVRLRGWRRWSGAGHQFHAAPRARPRLRGRDFRVHGADVGSRSRCRRVHGQQPHATLWTRPRL